ncbi:hypothetical protein MAR_018469 [Mya arenaria]|uniref:EF-hand domain-containing protein n=1 Tax=Mya arenaria TaxID=6604 RepID=A0ABY7EI83_MYAAR|nr:uncharacterized protein LOC128238431 [Mya arenaria]XP_052810310.1 uncharacterized protein LOC128238431 [Mya arenaria]XP_052810311.1 uncharacterized protein LOC128238431 [Mya arenaria]WAR08511.1 hypothetical protein MAR_018469 [Mya arenaria]
MGFKYLIVLVVLFVLLNPTECWLVKKLIKKIGKGIKKVVKKIKKVGCKVLFGVACPAVVGAAGTALGAGSGGIAGLVAGAAVIAGASACYVRQTKCKRSVENGMALLPFSDDFRDYDMNDDKRIEYEEFVYTVMRSVGLSEPMELREPFNIADFNGDGELNSKEFEGAPFLFAHANFHQFMKKEVPETSPSFEVSTAA